MRKLAITCFLLAPALSPAQSQLSVVPATPDLSPYATTVAVNAAIAAGTPGPCPVPLLDTLNGTLGSQPICMERPDRTNPTAVQSSTATTDASGNITVTFARSMVSASPSINLVPQNSGGSSLPIVCNWLTRSATGFTAGCWQSQTTTLGGTLVAIGGTVISPFKAGSSGVAVTWFAREPTQ